MLRPGTKVLGRPPASISIAMSRVNAVCDTSPREASPMVWSSPSRAFHSGFSAVMPSRSAVRQSSSIRWRWP